MYKKTSTMLFCLLLGVIFSVAGCSKSISAKQTTPNSSPIITNEPTASNSSPQKSLATFFEPETDWVKLAKTDKFKYWQIPEEYAEKAPGIEPAVGGIGEFLIKDGHLCFNRGNSMVPAVLFTEYLVSGEKIPEEYAEKAPGIEPAVGGIGEFLIKDGHLCFNRGNSMVPAVLFTEYLVSGEKIQISKDDFIKLEEKFSYDNGRNKSNITLISLRDSKTKLPKEFINSPCFQGDLFSIGKKI